MTITLNLTPEIEQSLRHRAQAQGISLGDYVEEIVKREASAARPAPGLSGQALVDAAARVRGLLTDEEVDTLFSRNRSSARAVDLE